MFRHEGCGIEGILCIAPGASEVTTGESNEDAGLTCEGGFALDRVEQFADVEGVIDHER